MKRRIKTKIKKKELYILLQQQLEETKKIKRLIEKMSEPIEMRVITSP